MRAVAPRWMARIGVTLSLMTTAFLMLVQWRTLSGPLDFGYRLVLSAGCGVSLGVLCTAVQALIHTRLGSRPMFPEHSQRAAPLPATAVLRWIARATGLLLLLSLLVRWLDTASIMYASTDSIVLAALVGLGNLRWLPLWPVLMLGTGLGFGTALLAYWLRPADRLAHAAPSLLSACQDTPWIGAVAEREPLGSRRVGGTDARPAGLAPPTALG
jgi:hypothetical protein